MTSTTNPTPTAEALAVLFEESDDHDVMHHTLWCDENTAMCGEDLTGEPWVTDEERAPDLECPECVAILRAGNWVHIRECAVCLGVEPDEGEYLIWLDPPN